MLKVWCEHTVSQKQLDSLACVRSQESVSSDVTIIHLNVQMCPMVFLNYALFRFSHMPKWIIQVISILIIF